MLTRRWLSPSWDLLCKKTKVNSRVIWSKLRSYKNRPDSHSCCPCQTSTRGHEMKSTERYLINNWVTIDQIKVNKQTRAEIHFTSIWSIRAKLWFTHLPHPITGNHFLISCSFCLSLLSSYSKRVQTGSKLICSLFSWYGSVCSDCHVERMGSNMFCLLMLACEYVGRSVVLCSIN